MILDCLQRLPLPDADLQRDSDVEIMSLVSDYFAAVTAKELHVKAAQSYDRSEPDRRLATYSQRP